MPGEPGDEIDFLVDMEDDQIRQPCGSGDEKGREAKLVASVAPRRRPRGE